MIKPFSFLCMLAAFGSGLYLYSEKHSAELLDRQIAHTIRATEAARQRTGLLRADWALLNDPGRLQSMADTYLALKPMAPNQFVQMADLGSKLPPPVVTPPNAAADAEDAADDAAAAQAAGATPAVTDLPVAAPADPGLSDTTEAVKAPLLVAQKPEAAKPPVPVRAPAKLVAHLAPRKPAHPVQVASRQSYGRDNALLHSAPLPLASPQPLGARVVSAMARPTPLRHSWGSTRPAVVAAVPTALGRAPYVGSALAGTGSLPPPVPMGAQ